jgi:diguanylate cyclase (GGDEF)-like protein
VSLLARVATWHRGSSRELRSHVTTPETQISTGPLGALVRSLARRPLAVQQELRAWVDGLSPRAATLVAVLAVLCVALGDGLTGPDVSFTVLYLGPIAFATWHVSLQVAIALSTLSAFASFASDVLTRSTPLPTVVVAWNLAVQLGMFFALVVLLAALKSRLVLEGRLARTDPLTLVSNRRAFVEQAGVELERSRRTGRPISVAYLDCDDFKVVNDLLGHAQGDALLVAVAATLRGGTRAVDSVARLGGDEFGLLLVDTDGAAADMLVERLRTSLAACMAENGWAVSFSIGTATFVTPPRSVDEMLRHADQLMYDAKRSGKNRARSEIVGRPAMSAA